MPFELLSDLTPTKIQWLIPSRLPLGHLAMLDGDPGLGKSLVTLDLCARITTGRPFPDGSPGAAPAAVVVINAEERARQTIHDRLRAAGADMTRVVVFNRQVGEAFLRLPGHLHRLEEAITRKGARYVVIDPVMSFLDANVNVASDPSVRAALAPLADLAERHDCAIHLVRHLNKGRGKSALARGLYSVGFIAACRASWFVGRDPRVSKQFVLAQPKNNFDPPQPSLAYRIEPDETGTARVLWQGVSPWSDAELLRGAPTRLRERFRAQEFLLDFLKSGPRTTREIWPAAEKQHLGKRLLQKACKALKIRTVPIHLFTPNQTAYWLLEGQKLPHDAGIDEATLVVEESLDKLMASLPGLTPLDDEFRKPDFMRSGRERDESEG